MTYSDVDILAALQRGASELNALDEESARGIENWIRVGPIDQVQLQPASIDLKLGNEFWRFLPSEYVDMVDRVVGMAREEWSDGTFVELKPKELMLATTVERIELGPRVCASIEGKSSLGRMGLAVHVTAGFVDPGFRGQITLELFNLSASTIRLRPGMAVCQVAFTECMTRAMRPYGSPGLGSRYQDQTGAVPVRS